MHIQFENTYNEGYVELDNNSLREPLKMQKIKFFIMKEYTAEKIFISKYLYISNNYKNLFFFNKYKNTPKFVYQFVSLS